MLELCGKGSRRSEYLARDLLRGAAGLDKEDGEEKVKTNLMERLTYRSDEEGASKLCEEQPLGEGP